MRKIFVVLLLATGFMAGIYFSSLGGPASGWKNDFIGYVEGFKEADLGQIISEVQKKVLTPDPLRVTGAESQVVLVKSKIIQETNIHRQNNGQSILKENTLLNNVALAKAQDMFKNQYFEHESPTGIDPGKLVISYGYNYILAGENLILGNFDSEQEVVQNWMDSPGHRENILNSRYTEIGVAIIKGAYKGETVWMGVQEFGLPLSSCGKPDSNLMSQIDSGKAQLDSLSAQLDEKKTQIESADAKSPAYSQMVDDYNELVRQYNLLAEQTKSEIADYNNQVNAFNVCVSGT